MTTTAVGYHKIAWLTHHLPVEDTGGGKWLPGKFRGGAEMSDHEYREAAPPWVQIDLFDPNRWEECLNYERIVITGTDLLSEQAMARLAEEHPMVFVHHEQTETAGRALLLEAAEPFVCHTPAHLERERLWVDLPNAELVLSHFNTEECWVGKKEMFALWAARNHPQKGLNQAKIWANAFGIDLFQASDLPREDVLALMAEAEWFVHTPLSFESECRSVMEAVLSGCRIHTNTNVGITSVPGWEDRLKLKEMIDTAGQDFWACVYQ